MAEQITRSRAGMRPGELHDQDSQAVIHWVRYNESFIEYGVLEDFHSLPARKENECLWLDIIGTPGFTGLEALHMQYGLHRLALEDVQNGGQTPKIDGFDDHIYTVLQLPKTGSDPIAFEQLNLFLADALVISIHKQTPCADPDAPNSQLFDPIRARLDAARGAIRGATAEYLLYALVDLAVDIGSPVSHDYTEVLIDLETRVDDGDTDLSREIYGVRRQLSAFLRQTKRQEEMIRILFELDHDLISGDYEHYWRDAMDHAIRLSEGLNHSRETAADLLNTHLALISHRMNDVMKVLTIMSTVFIPLSFLVGLYGMNFDTESHWNMPELSWRYGYLYIWGVMICVVSGLLWFFRSKRWI